ncbi:MAG: NTP transferase domain-containing protein [Acidobacteria bacterium]|nr:NTP transferase domain-containing protein [Acidobacteriota bacterium]
MRALILAAGLGSRLFPLTQFRAKPSIPFLNRPLVCHSVDSLRRAGVTKITVNLHHLSETVRTSLSGDSGIHFVYEPKMLGTAGAISNIRHFVEGSEPFFLYNGKIYFEEDLSRVYVAHQQSKALATLVVVPRDPRDDFSPVFADAESRIVKFGNPPRGGEFQAFTFTGVHVISRSLLDHIPPGPSDIVRDVYLKLLATGRIRTFVSSAYWCECSTPARYLTKSLEVLCRKGLKQLMAGGEFRDAMTQVIAGSGLKAAEGCHLENCVLWEGIELGKCAQIRNAVLSDGVRIPPYSKLSNAIVTPALAEHEKRLREAGGTLNGSLAVWPLRQSR